MAAGDDVRENSGVQLGALPDEALARRVQRGDRNALEQLFRRYLRPIHAVAASYLSEADVEDAAQETFLRAIRGIETYNPRRPFAPWLYQIARNVARTNLAAGARQRIELLSETRQSSLPEPDVMLERSELRAQVNGAIARLPERRRTAFYLSDVQGYTTDKVARMMDLSPGTVRSHVHYARTALRAALGKIREQVENTGGPSDDSTI